MKGEGLEGTIQQVEGLATEHLHCWERSPRNCLVSPGLHDRDIRTRICKELNLLWSQMRSSLVDVSRFVVEPKGSNSGATKSVALQGSDNVTTDLKGIQILLAHMCQMSVKLRWKQSEQFTRMATCQEELLVDQ